MFELCELCEVRIIINSVHYNNVTNFNLFNLINSCRQFCIYEENSVDYYFHTTYLLVRSSWLCIVLKHQFSTFLRYRHFIKGIWIWTSVVILVIIWRPLIVHLIDWYSRSRCSISCCRIHVEQFLWRTSFCEQFYF